MADRIGKLERPLEAHQGSYTKPRRDDALTEAPTNLQPMWGETLSTTENLSKKLKNYHVFFEKK